MRTRVALAAATALLLPLAGSALGHDDHTPPSVENGTAAGPERSVAAKPARRQPHAPDMAKLDPVRYSLKDAVVEHVEVPSRNGVDVIWVDIIRPKTKPGVKVPTIMDASPYFNTLGRGWEGHCKTPTTGCPPHGHPRPRLQQAEPLPGVLRRLLRARAATRWR
jgi:hypothetical protein